MVETVIRYRSNDGIEFVNRDDAVCHERLNVLVAEVMSAAPRHEMAGGEYIQWARDDLFAVRRNLFELTKQHYAKQFPEMNQWNPDEIDCMGMTRYLDGNFHCPINKGWGRLCCFNFQLYREYSQCFYALNPDNATKEIKP